MEAVTQNDLLEALRQALERAPDNSGALTCLEIARETGWDIKSARERIRAMIHDGRAECIRVSRKRIDGVMQMTPAYRLKS